MSFKNLKSYFLNLLKASNGFISKLNSAPLLNTMRNVFSKPQYYHQKAYNYLVTKPSYQSLTLVLVLLLVYSVVFFPLIVWLLNCFACGEWLTDIINVNMWIPTERLITTLINHARLCGTAAACQGYHGLAYTGQFFSNMLYDSSVVWFHALFALLLCFSAGYFASMFMSLAQKKPKVKWAPSYTYLFGLLGYALILIMLGLSSSGPNADGYMGAWLLAVFALFAMHVLTWLIEAYNCQYLAQCALVVLFGLTLIGYAIALAWPDIVAFYNWVTESIALMLGKFHWALRHWVERLKRNPLVNNMGMIYDTKEEKAAKQAEALKDKVCEKAQPCEEAFDQNQANIFKHFEDGTDDATTTVEKTMENFNQKAHCKQRICDYEMHKLNERQRQASLEREHQMQTAKHTGDVKIAESPARPVRDLGNAASQAAEAYNRSQQNRAPQNQNQN